MKDCKYISEYSNEDSKDITLIEVKGVDLINTDNIFCDTCEEWMEDVENNALDWSYRRR